jgi:CDP-diacylglycerol--serine O-phosphatidyltransferase
MRIDLKRRRRGPGGPSVIRMLPNALTTLALCAGMNAIRFAVQGRWEAGVIAIVIAGILDTLDGRTARLLNAQSKFGAELDSLSDIVCFGVAPAILVYLWALHDAGNFGWLATLSLGICAALRLARFNTALAATSTAARSVKAAYFVGVPTPAAAGLAILPMMIDFEMGGPMLASHPYPLSLWTVAMALLMVSRVPTPSLSGIHIRPKLRLPLLAIIGIAAGAIVDMPWATLISVAAVYLISLPYYAWKRPITRPIVVEADEVMDGEEIS